MDKSLQVISMYVLTHMGLIFLLYPADMISSMGVGHWLAILFGYALHVTVISVYMKGLGYFPGEDLIDILLKWGRTAATLLLLPVAAYLFIILVSTTRACSEVITIIFLSGTPLWATAALLIFISTYMANIGSEALMRTGAMLACLSIPLVIFLLVMSFQNADWRYFFPAIDKKAATFSFLLNRDYIKSLFAFAGGFLFLGFIPSQVSYKRKKILRGSVLLIPLYIISVYGPIMTFGQNTASKFQFPFIMNIDTVEIDWLMFDRITMFFLLSMIMFNILFLAIVLWQAVRIIHRPFQRLKPVYPLLALSLIVFVVCISIPGWVFIEQLFWWNTILRFYAFTIIPAVTLTIGFRRGRKGSVAP